jgi:hypothetical protein
MIKCPLAGLCNRFVTWRRYSGAMLHVTGKFMNTNRLECFPPAGDIARAIRNG